MPMFSFQEDDQPCHDEHDRRAYGSAEVGFHTGNADLGKNRGKCGENCRKDGVEKPAVIVFLRGSFLFFDHKENSRDKDCHSGETDSEMSCFTE